MQSFHLKSNFVPFNDYYSQFPLLELLYGQYLVFPHLFTHPPQYCSEGDESQNVEITVKSQQNEEMKQFPTFINEVNAQAVKKQKTEPKHKSEDGNYINKCQKDDRNLNSIVIRNFINFLMAHPRLNKIVEEVIYSKNLTITSSEYVTMLKNAFLHRKSYIGVGKLKNFIGVGNQHYEIKLITLILLRKFINIDFFTVMLNSKKVSRNAKEKQLKHGKKFWKEFSSQFF